MILENGLSIVGAKTIMGSWEMGPTNNLTPVFTKLPVGSKAVAISSGFNHNCVISTQVYIVGVTLW